MITGFKLITHHLDYGKNIQIVLLELVPMFKLFILTCVKKPSRQIFLISPVKSNKIPVLLLSVNVRAPENLFSRLDSCQ